MIKNGALLATPFATTTVDPRSERGLLGVAIDPDFATNGFVYVYSTRRPAAARTTASAASPPRATSPWPAAKSSLVELANLSSATNHNGGALHFGADGKLYVAVGDNANGGQLAEPQQPVRQDAAHQRRRHASPPTTRSSNQPAWRARSGPRLRNPFTFAFQPGTGRIYINDVGQGTWEEINAARPAPTTAGPARKGNDNVTGRSRLRRSSPTSTAMSRRSAQGPGGFFKGAAIAGGDFYPAAGALPAGYRGQYYFADYVNRSVGRLDQANGNVAYAFASLAGSPVDLRVASDGALLVLTRSGVTRITAP